MQTFAQQKNKPRTPVPPLPARSHRQAPSPKTQTKLSEAPSHGSRHDFSRIPIHPPAAGAMQVQRSCGCGGGCSGCSGKLGAHEQSHVLDFASMLAAGEIQRDGPASPGSQPKPEPAETMTLFCNKPPYDSAQIRRALSTARVWVGSVIPMLGLFKMGKLNEEQRTVVSTALRDNFNITDPSPRLTLLPEPPIDTILNNFIAIDRALNRSMTFYCTDVCLPGDLAWVVRDPEGSGMLAGNISICPGFFGCDPLKQASTIIHERAHEAIAARDHAYEVSGNYDSLATITALENADSYAVAARQIVHRGMHGPGLSCNAVLSRVPDPKLMEPTLQLPAPQQPGLQLPVLPPPGNNNP
jgi:hypothetical protein